jgi:hypothetical protein
MLALMLIAGAVQAAPGHSIEAASWGGEVYFRQGPQSLPAADHWRGSRYSLDIDAEARSDSAGLLARYHQDGWAEWPAGGESGWAGARGSGLVLITADVPGGPSFIDLTLNLRLVGQANLTAMQDAMAHGGFEVRVTVPGDDANLVESAAVGMGAPAPTQTGQNLWRSGTDGLVAALHLPVGQAFSMGLILFANGGSQGAGVAMVSSDYTLGLFEASAVFDLPAGYSAWSDDWGIQDNRWCPGGCAAVPEPSPWLLLIAGLGAVRGRIRRHR